MSGNKSGYEKRKQSLEEKYGIEGYAEKRREWSSKGGKKSGGFANMTPELRSEAGRKGQAALREKMKKRILIELGEEDS